MAFTAVFRCTHCQTKWKGKLATLDSPNPPCPNLNCAEIAGIISSKHRQENEAAVAFEFDPAGKPPAMGGATIVKAIDYTAEMVMQEHQMTNLKDNLRDGDSMAPPLPVAQQKAADSFFSAGANSQIGKKRAAQMQQMGKRAMAGAYRSSALDIKSVLPDARVALKSVGSFNYQNVVGGKK